MIRTVTLGQNIRTSALSLLVALLGWPGATPAQAAAASDYEVVYFADRQMTQEVGNFYKPCGTGSAQMTGRRTRYFAKSQSKCPGRGGISNVTVSCNFTKEGCNDALVGRLLPLIKPPRN